jgi:predicted transposase YdaD
VRGANESFVRELAAEVVADRSLSERDRSSTLQLLYIVSAAILGSETARRIFHMESIIQDPNVQELIREWEDKGRAEGLVDGRAEGRAEGLVKGRAEGLVKGRAEGLVEGGAAVARVLLHRLLAVRSIPVTPDARARIDAESDVARLESWVLSAATADTISDVFGDG